MLVWEEIDLEIGFCGIIVTCLLEYVVPFCLHFTLNLFSMPIFIIFHAGRIGLLGHLLLFILFSAF